MVKIMNISEKIDQLSDIFDLFDDPKDKYIQLMDIGKSSEGLKFEERIEKNKIYGCTSQAWLVTRQGKNKTYFFKTDSDALIVRGLLKIIEDVLGGETFKVIDSIDSNSLLKLIGLNSSITSQRINGLSSALEKIKKDIKWMEMKR